VEGRAGQARGSREAGTAAADRRAGMTQLPIGQREIILAKIGRGPRPHATLRVWNAALAHVAADTGALEVSRTQLATGAGVSPQAVSRTLSRLVEIGALIRIAPGRYAINPAAWSGSLASREQAAQKPGPHLVEPA
jgi:DNA-binding transcriptional ArsR family regulator